MPFAVLVYMVGEWFPTAGEAEVARRTGLLASLSNLAGAVTSLPWGRFSDKRGRRPVLYIGNSAAAVSILSLGLCRSYGAACAVRLAGGFLNGSLGSVKAVIADVCDDTNQPFAFSVLSTAWGVGAVLGPAAGGLLSRPCAEGGIYGPASARCQPGTMLLAHPYLLPCAFASVLCATAGFLSYRMQETLKTAAKPVAEVELQQVSTSVESESEDARLLAPASAPPTLWWQDTQVRLCLLGYTLCSGIFIQLDELIPLFSAAPAESGGLQLEPRELAAPLAFGGAVVFCFTLFLYPRLVRALGLRRLTNVGFKATAAAVLAVPTSSLFVGGARRFIFYAAMGFRGMAATAVFTSSMILVNRACPVSQLGEVNGMGQLLASLVRGIGPALAGLEWAASVRSSARFAQFGAFALVALTSLGGLALYARVDFHEEEEGGEEVVAHAAE